LAYTVPVRVTWNEEKNLSNEKKHGVSFDEATELFTSGTDLEPPT